MKMFADLPSVLGATSAWWGPMDTRYGYWLVVVDDVGREHYLSPDEWGLAPEIKAIERLLGVRLSARSGKTDRGWSARLDPSKPWCGLHRSEWSAEKACQKAMGLPTYDVEEELRKRDEARLLSEQAKDASALDDAIDTQAKARAGHLELVGSPTSRRLSTVQHRSSVDPIPGWAEAIADDAVRNVFLHIERHGVIDEAEVTRILGSPRATRRFSVEWELHRTKLPFNLRTEPGESGKRWVNEGNR